MSPEDLKEELAPVIAQQVYTLLKMGNVAEAEKASRELDTKTYALRSYICPLELILAANSLIHSDSLMRP